MTDLICLDRFAKPGEKRAAVKLVNAALDAGFAVSVNDGEETTVRLTRDRGTILEALCTTGHDRLICYRFDEAAQPQYQRAGVLLLVWGNDPDGSELIADHTDNAAMNELVAKVQP